MATAPPLQPTLWRTCRVLANRTRLRIFCLLVHQPNQTVSSVAERLKLPLPVASQSLRALEARGLLVVRRVGLRVTYRPSAAAAGGDTQAFVAALRQTLRREPPPIEMLYKLSTAFTHPQRIEIFRALQNEPPTLRQLQAASGISVRALLRHLKKLKARGFVVCQRGRYKVATRPDAFARELARLAAGER